jgi:hypothetical protein
MTIEHFLEAFEEELRRQRIHSTRPQIEDFVKQHWHAIVKEPDVARWARTFLDSGQTSVSV